MSKIDRVAGVKTVRIGLLGVGTVGHAVARALIERRDVLSRAAGAAVVLQRAAVRDLSRPRPLPREQLTTDPATVARADDVDLVVELMGGEEPARGLMVAALERGKPVVTANKRVLAWHGPQLAALAASKGVELRYEAAVGGGIPLIAPLTDDLAANRVLELHAIINGTCNYVLTRMAQGETLEAALTKAQEAGYAEADPRDDVDGVDALDKLCILVRLAFNAACTPAQIHRQGIRGLDPRDLAYGRELGYVLKLLAIARRGAGGGVEARVHPAFLPADHPLARVDGAQNAVHVVGDLCGPVMFSGLGAGGDATAQRGAGRRGARRAPARARRSGSAAARFRTGGAADPDGGGEDALLLPPLGRRRARRLRAGDARARRARDRARQRDPARAGPPRLRRGGALHLRRARVGAGGGGGGALEAARHARGARAHPRGGVPMRRGVLARWAAHLPITAKTPALTLGEGDTPLITAPTLARDIGCKELWLKFEGMNPTGSFKDRGMVVAVAKAIEDGAKAAICASTGNTSASARGVCARARGCVHVVVPEGKIALGKLAQAVVHGARDRRRRRATSTPR